MDVHLQLGWGMRGHSRALIEKWKEGTVVLSPRDLDPDALRTFKDRFPDEKGNILVDPQFFDPEADFDRLTGHEYWPMEYEEEEFWKEDGGHEGFVERVLALNAQLGCSRVIVPGLLLESADDQRWFRKQGIAQKEVLKRVEDPDQLMATVAVRSGILGDEDQVHALLRQSQHWKVGGIYLLAELPPGDTFFATDDEWLFGLLDTVAGYRMRGFDVVIGHVNQQMLAAAIAAPEAIASGTKKNVRYFELDRYFETEGGGGRARPTWYYVPQALSEYRVSDLNTVQEEGLLEAVRPPDGLGDTPAATLFQEAVLEGTMSPTTVSFTTGDSVRHYLESLRWQARAVSRGSFDETVDAVRSMLDDADDTVEALGSIGVFARDAWRSEQDRRGTRLDPSTAMRNAVERFVSTRGPMCRQLWRVIES